MVKHKNPVDPDLEPTDEVPTELLSHPSYQELMRQLDEAEKKGQESWERLLRLQAEQENLLRRSEKNIENAHKYALEKFVTELLPIIDSLELCVEKVPVELEAPAAAVIEGVGLTLKMFYATLEKFGIRQVNPIDQPFDPELHQAISIKEDASMKPGTVVSVMQKGYTLNGRLARPALVIVSKNG
ncbi:MAG: nucleotide exchange factor GrpE [Gammaproteobacteria bacterium RIFCSPHIGHO2_12_FULL_43_28]|nr:MAG: nucleotide exchange factor GrpE [Gammaproteobacteria bacterium RIFCSPHIGHO2_12_FULL_43_28]